MIYTELKGRLGNQMFIYAFAYALSRENGNEPICFCGERNGNSLYHYRLRNVVSCEGKTFPMSFFQRVLLWGYSKQEAKLSRAEFYEYEKKKKELYQRNGLYLCQNGYLPLSRRAGRKEDIYLNGYFQSERYFQSVRDELREIFIPQYPIKEENISIHQRIKESKEAVCVDFRMGDYVNSSLHGICTLDYYRKAMEYMCRKLHAPVFYIFSTDVSYIRAMMEDWKFDYVIEDGQSADYEKLRLMSECKHFIITNSTYDWWAQYLASGKEKVVVAPSRWFGKECPCDIYMDDWVRISC